MANPADNIVTSSDEYFLNVDRSNSVFAPVSCNRLHHITHESRVGPLNQFMLSGSSSKDIKSPSNFESAVNSFNRIPFKFPDKMKTSILILKNENNNIGRKRWKQFAIAAAFNLFTGIVFLVFLILCDELWTNCRPTDGDVCVFGLSPIGWRDILGSLPEAMLSIIAIAITIVSFILELSAARYSTSIISMFFLDVTARIVLQFLISTSVLCIWVNVRLTNDLVPQTLISVTLAFMTISVVIVVPFFKYVFSFTYPSHQIAMLLNSCINVIKHDHSRRVDESHKHIIKYAQIIASYALVSHNNKDSYTAYQTVHAFENLLEEYVKFKRNIDEISWFEMTPHVTVDLDFENLSFETLKDLVKNRTWLEWKVLCIYESIFYRAIGDMNGVCRQISMCMRIVATQAVRNKDSSVVQLIMKFFNTFLRVSITQLDGGVGCHLLHQYRQLGEVLVASDMFKEVEELTSYFKYYAHIALSEEFVTFSECCAYDLAQLCETAHALGYSRQNDILSSLLDIDKCDDGSHIVLTGVRKAQLKLATYYSLLQEVELQHRIRIDMMTEAPERLENLKIELLAVSGKKSWEKDEQGNRFDYLTDSRRAKLVLFIDEIYNIMESARAEREPLRVPDSDCGFTNNTSIKAWAEHHQITPFIQANEQSDKKFSNVYNDENEERDAEKGLVGGQEFDTHGQRVANRSIIRSDSTGILGRFSEQDISSRYPDVPTPLTLSRHGSQFFNVEEIGEATIIRPKNHSKAPQHNIIIRRQGSNTELVAPSLPDHLNLRGIAENRRLTSNNSTYCSPTGSFMDIPANMSSEAKNKFRSSVHYVRAEEGQNTKKRG